jgi:hypothetical protein
MASGVEFDEDNMGFRRPLPGGGFSTNKGYQQRQGGLAGWLIKKGWAKSNSSAQMIMIGVVIVNVIITYFLIKFFL